MIILDIGLSRNYLHFHPLTHFSSSRKNPFGLTIALDELMIAQGQIFWDDGEAQEHVMSESYMSSLAYYQVGCENHYTFDTVCHHIFW